MREREREREKRRRKLQINYSHEDRGSSIEFRTCMFPNAAWLRSLSAYGIYCTCTCSSVALFILQKLIKIMYCLTSSLGVIKSLSKGSSSSALSVLQGLTCGKRPLLRPALWELLCRLKLIPERPTLNFQDAFLSRRRVSGPLLLSQGGFIEKRSPSFFKSCLELSGK